MKKNKLNTKHQLIIVLVSIAITFFVVLMSINYYWNKKQEFYKFENNLKIEEEEKKQNMITDCISASEDWYETEKNRLMNIHNNSVREVCNNDTNCMKELNEGGGIKNFLDSIDEAEKQLENKKEKCLKYGRSE